MTANCATANCNCGVCNACQGIELADVTVQPRVSANTALLGTDSYAYTIQAIANYLLLGETGFGYKTVTGDYTATVDDDSIRVEGANTITVPNGRGRPLNIYAATANVPITATIENWTGPLALGTAITLYPVQAGTGYYVG